MEKTRFALISLPINEYRFSIIGPLALATYIQKNMKKVEVKIIDRAFEDVDAELRKFNPEIIGLSTFTSYYQDTIAFAKKIKQKNSNIKIIVGGPHINTLPESFDKIFDYGVIGEGERTLAELLDAIINKKSVEKIRGLIYYKNDKLIFNKKRDFAKKLDWEIDYNLMNKGYFEKRFIPELRRFESAVGIMTSLGCPFNCRFCAVKSCWDKIRFREVDEVIKEIKDLYYNFGVRHIDFYDDLFSANIPRLKEFYEKMKKAGLLGKVSFSCQVRTNMISNEMCSVLKNLNVKTVMFGFESASDRILQYIKNDPSLSAEKHKKAIEICKKYGLNVYGSLMFAMPGEKLEDMQKSLDFIDYGLKKGVGRLWAQVLAPLPGTEMWEIAKQRGKIGKDFYNLGITMYNKERPLLLDPDVKYEDFLRIYNAALKKCRVFVYRIAIKTLAKNPFLIFYFMKDFLFYLKRTINFLNSNPID